MTNNNNNNNNNNNSVKEITLLNEAGSQDVEIIIDAEKSEKLLCLIDTKLPDIRAEDKIERIYGPIQADDNELFKLGDNPKEIINPEPCFEAPKQGLPEASSKKESEERAGKQELQQQHKIQWPKFLLGSILNKRKDSKGEHVKN